MFLSQEQPIRVVWIIHNRRATGPYPKLIEQLRALAERGVEVSLVCTSPAARVQLREVVDETIPVIEAPDLLWGRWRQGVDLWNAIRRVGWLRRSRPDVVHAIDARPAVILPALFARGSLGAAMVLSWWDLFGDGGTALERSGRAYASTLGRVESAFETGFRRRADWATAISQPLYRRLLALGFPADRASIIRLGCDARRFPVRDKVSARVRLGWDATVPVACYVGSLQPADQALFIAAVQAARRLGERALRVVWIGAPDRTAIPPEAGIESAGRIPLEQVYDALAGADLCLLPLRASAGNAARWPSKAADYLNAGRPIVCTPVSDVGEIVTANRLGFVSASDAPSDFAAAIRLALASSSEWDAQGRRSRAYAEEQLDVRALATQLMHAYEGALRHRASATRGE